MDVQKIIFGHFEYNPFDYPQLESTVQEKILQLELAGYAVLRAQVPDSHVILRILGNLDQGHDPDIVAKFFSPLHNFISRIGSSIYLISGELFLFNGFKVVTLTDLDSVSTPKELSAKIFTIVDNYAHHEVEVPAMYVALVIRELSKKIGDFFAHLPKNAVQRRVHLAAFIREIIQWHSTLNPDYAKRYVVKAAMGEQLKKVWEHKAISAMRSDFKSEVYVDSRLHLNWDKISELRVNYLNTLAHKVHGNWDPVAQCRGI